LERLFGGQKTIIKCLSLQDSETTYRITKAVPTKYPNFTIMKPDEIYFLNYVKTKVLPKYGLTENDVSFSKNDEFFIMKYLIQGRRIEDIMEWYNKAEKLYDEISTICYITTKKKLDNIVVESEEKTENLLNLI
jgi:hypothetical protein